jgi:hypothetical protein
MLFITFSRRSVDRHPLAVDDDKHTFFVSGGDKLAIPLKFGRVSMYD